MEKTLENIKVSAIIPSLDGSRGGNVTRLMKQLAKQSLKPDEIIVVEGVSPNGKARNEGASKATGDFYVLIDDDTVLGNKMVIENLVRPMLDDPTIGLTSPSQLIPEKSTWFQRLTAKQIPRTFFPVQSELVDSDMATHMCLCVPAELFKKIGWENPEIISGTDPDLRHRVRLSGHRVCVVPGTWAYHPPPETLDALLKTAYRKGKNSAMTCRRHPDLVYELDGGFNKEFAATRPFHYRVFRRINVIIYSLLTFRFLLCLHSIAYTIGFIVGAIHSNATPPSQSS